MHKIINQLYLQNQRLDESLIDLIKKYFDIKIIKFDKIDSANKKMLVNTDLSSYFQSS
jgi:hypothetical protein